MRRVNHAALLIILLQITNVSYAELDAGLHPPASADTSIVVDELLHDPSAHVVKYVRNISNPNGFGEEKIINEAVFHLKNADVKADTGDMLEYAIVITAPNRDLEAVAIKDSIPAFTEYVPDSTFINSMQIADVDGKAPLLEAMLVNDASSALHSGVIKAETSAVVIFRVRVNLMLDIPDRG